MSEHIDVEVLSDLVEGLLAPEREAELAAHLAECDECRDTRDSLAEIRELLGDLPVEPMPADVAARIDGALALAALPPPRPAEAPSPTPARPTDPPRSAEHTEHTVVSLDAARKRRRRGPLLLAAAAVAAVTLGITVIVGSDGDSRHSGGSSSDAKANAPAAAPAPSAASRPSGSGEKPNSDTKEQTPKPPSAVDFRVYTDDGLPEQVSRLLSRSTPAPKQSLPACVAAAVGPGADKPLATDTGIYRNTRVWVVVLDGKADTRVRVTIVDASCGAPASTRPSTPRSTGLSASPSAGASNEFAGAVLLNTEVARG
ncbi:anti-sigma factor family protein [Embleya sp. NBC_00896]|uniref:anti-sigma factor family protein n=1 Tax=Embleya sp. NBC_00896 TaxID=2975961 RepID=UPI00386E0CB0|nr:zf-HC2 domain-containing protein [Embleya sp. NBC_00896]